MAVPRAQKSLFDIKNHLSPKVVRLKFSMDSVGEELPAEKRMKSFLFCVFPVGYLKSSQTASFSRLEIASFGK